MVQGRKFGLYGDYEILLVVSFYPFARGAAQGPAGARQPPSQLPPLNLGMTHRLSTPGARSFWYTQFQSCALQILSIS